MDCREEVAIIERRFKNLRGLEDFSADLMRQRLHVKYDAAKLSASAISAAVADAGMRAWLEHEEPVATGDRVGAGAHGCSSPAAADGSPRVSPHVCRCRTHLAIGLACSAAAIAAGVPLTARKAWQCRASGRSTSTC